jgi:hypothetical protein
MGGIVRISRCRKQPVSETVGNRPGHDRRDGRSDRQQPLVAMVFSLLPRREGEAHAKRRAATGGAAIISDEGVRGSSRGLQRPQRGDFPPAFPPPISGMT